MSCCKGTNHCRGNARIGCVRCKLDLCPRCIIGTQCGFRGERYHAASGRTRAKKVAFVGLGGMAKTLGDHHPWAANPMMLSQARAVARE